MNNFRIIVKKEFLLLAALISLLYLFLEAYYCFYISQQFDYMLYAYDLNLFKYFLTKIIFLLLLAGSLHLYNRSRFLYSIHLLLIFFFFIPNAILFSLGNFANGPFLSNVFFVSAFLLTPYLKFSFRFPVVPEKFRGILMASAALILLVPIILKFGSHINLKTLFLAEIYETREIFSEKLTGLLAYLYNIEAKTIIPVALVFFLLLRKYFLAALVFLMLVYLYVISGNKLIYFTSMIMIFFFFIGKDYVSKLSNFFLIVILAFAFFPIIDSWVLSEPLFAGTFVNRFLFIPALLTQFYFDFFDGTPFFFAESSFFNRFVHSPYDMPVGFLITREYWNEPEVYANNGIVSDGFMNLDYAGVIVFSFIFSALFSFFNSMNLHKGFYGIFFCYIYIILSAPFLSTFITGGILVFIFITITMLRNTNHTLHSSL